MERESDGKIKKKGWEIAVKHDKIRKKWTERDLGTDEGGRQDPLFAKPRNSNII